MCAQCDPGLQTTRRAAACVCVWVCVRLRFGRVCRLFRTVTPGETRHPERNARPWQRTGTSFHIRDARRHFDVGVKLWRQIQWWIFFLRQPRKRPRTSSSFHIRDARRHFDVGVKLWRQIQWWIHF